MENEEITKLKVEVFDLAEEQGKLQTAWQKIEKAKNEKLEQIEKLRASN